ncbi:MULTISPECIES: branched-chain amino acid ABC transporter substrate-binding protein [unclassified Bradyrhizobium]|uniref:branched-chain amino acid ABC transporter substrate-binding protein n=1 Tax=unclassified Bradyrhizobium TaxID=2631580 RepID=UPI0032E50230
MTHQLSRRAMLGTALAGLTALALPARAATDKVRVAFIDPLSGGGAIAGEHGARHFRFLIDKINAAGGVLGGTPLELVVYDNKSAVQDTLIQAQKAIDAGTRIIVSGFGSNVALGLSDFLQKHNSRNPEAQAMFLNYGTIDPALTNEKCSYWHFRFDADAEIKMHALTSFIRDRNEISKVYVIGQDYSFGQAVRASARRLLAEKRPDIAIVADELHPLLKVNDFAPYIAKIKASGADSVITGNWGQDLALLLKAAADAGLKVDWYTFYAGLAGSPTAVRQTGLDHRIYQVVEWHSNVPGKEMQDLNAEFRWRYDGKGWWYLRAKTAMDMLVKAIDTAKAIDAAKISAAMEGMRIKNALGAEVWMRKDDHQAFQDLYVASFGSGVPVDEEGTGWGWKTVATIAAADTLTRTVCQMDRPS